MVQYPACLTSLLPPCATSNASSTSGFASARCIYHSRHPPHHHHLLPQALHRMRVQHSRCQRYQQEATGTTAAGSSASADADAGLDLAGGQAVLDLMFGNTAGYLAQNLHPVFQAMDDGRLAALVPELASPLRGYQAPRPSRHPLAALLGGFLEGLEEEEGGCRGWAKDGAACVSWSSAAWCWFFCGCYSHAASLQPCLTV